MTGQELFISLANQFYSLIIFTWSLRGSQKIWNTLLLTSVTPAMTSPVHICPLVSPSSGCKGNLPSPNQNFLSASPHPPIRWQLPRFSSISLFQVKKNGLFLNFLYFYTLLITANHPTKKQFYLHVKYILNVYIFFLTVADPTAVPDLLLFLLVQELLTSPSRIL